MFFKESKTFLLEEQKNFLNWFCSKEQQPFYFNAYAVTEGDNGFHFIHHFISKYRNYYNKNPYQSKLEDILETFAKSQKIKIKTIFRCALNITFFNGHIDKVPVHIDHNFKHKQLLIYLNDSTGDTVILNKNLKPIKIIKPEMFKGVCFNNLPHYHYFPINGVRKVIVYTFI